MLIRFLLVTINVVLGAELALLVTSPVEPTPTAAQGRMQLARSEPASEGIAALRPEIAQIDRRQALARPLFSPDRRPWMPPVQPAAGPAPAPGPVYQVETEPEADFILIGIGVARGRARALLTSGAGDHLGWVGEGETVSDWTIRAIFDRTVTIERAEREVSLSLDADASRD